MLLFDDGSCERNALIKGKQERELVNFCRFVLIFIHNRYGMGTMSKNFRSLGSRLRPWQAFEVHASSA